MSSVYVLVAVIGPVSSLIAVFEDALEAQNVCNTEWKPKEKYFEGLGESSRYEVRAVPFVKRGEKL